MIGLLTSRIAGYAAMAATVLLAGFLARAQFTIWNHENTIASLRLVLASTKSDKSSLERDVVVLRGSIDDQNRAVTDMKAKAAAAEARADMALAGLRDASRRASALAAQIASRMPEPGVDVCVAALDEARRPST